MGDFERGVQLHNARRYSEAREAFIGALLGCPLDEEALWRLSSCIANEGEYGAAMSVAEEAIALSPSCAQAWAVGGVCQIFSGRFRQAKIYLEKSLQIAPNVPAVKWNLSHCLLAVGDYRNGWEAYEWGKSVPGLRPTRTPGPQWKGEPTDKRLFVWAEQGIGDVIQFLRFIPEVQKRCPNIILEVQAPLYRLVRESFPGVTVIGKPADEAIHHAYELNCSVASLPLILGVEDRVQSKPYLRAEPNQEFKGKTILCWKGSNVHKNDAMRSIPAEMLEPLKGKADFATIGELWDCPQVPLGDFLQSADAVMASDRVITVDTSTAHLAGALGKEVWMIAPKNGEWRWGLEGEKSIWYESMRIFRPNVADGFEPVIQQIAEELNGKPKN